MSYINILLWGNEYNKSNKITSDTLWEAYISCIQFLYSSEKQSSVQQLPLLSVCSDDSYCQLKSFLFFLVSRSGCSSTPVSLHRLLDLCKEKEEERKTDKNLINLNLKVPLEDNGGHTEYQARTGRGRFYVASMSKELCRLAS